MTPIVFDSHCHIQDSAFDADREQVYQRAQAQSIGLIVPGYSMKTSSEAMTFAGSHDNVYALVGVHPHDAQYVVEDDYQTLQQWCADPNVVGVGEIGLDYHYMNSPREVQREVFRRQLILARDLGLPVSVHSREADADTLELIGMVEGVFGILHCFSGTEEFAKALINKGFYISFAGPISFKSAHALRATIPGVPWDRILVETDAPYLSPAPWRGQRNEPLRVIRNAEVVAAQKGCTTKEVFAATLSNTYTVFSRIRQ